MNKLAQPTTTMWIDYWFLIKGARYDICVLTCSAPTAPFLENYRIYLSYITIKAFHVFAREFTDDRCRRPRKTIQFSVCVPTWLDSGIVVQQVHGQFPRFGLGEAISLPV